MNVLIVYDSVFGNTEQIALAMGNALGAVGTVETVRPDGAQIDNVQGLDALIVGSPTRGFRATDAIMKFLRLLSEDDLRGVKVAAFDTRLSLSDIESSVVRVIVKTGGYAAKRIANQLKKKGGIWSSHLKDSSSPENKAR